MKTRVISTEIWDSDEVYSLNIDTKLLYLIILTNPYIGQSRYYKINDRQLSTFSGLNVDQLKKCKKDLEEANMVFFKDNYVCITGTGYIESFYKGAKNDVSRIKEINSIPDDILLFFRKKLDVLGIPIFGDDKPTSKEIYDNRRKKMSNTRRIRLYKLFGKKCNICKDTESEFELDHIVPLHLGGLDIDSNIQVLCTKCHLNKSALETKNRNSYRVSEISDTTINNKSYIINTKELNQEEKKAKFKEIKESLKQK